LSFGVVAVVVAVATQPTVVAVVVVEPSPS
jgi:hypothetical protein